VANSSELMSNAPSAVDEKQLTELGIAVLPQPAKD
jgi:aspartyl-tRNA synthetase